MSELLPFIVSGIAVGAIYGLAATGLVLTYKTSGIFNFGYGALATIAAYAFYWLHVQEGVDWGIALMLCVLVLGPLMGVLMERFAARLAPQRIALKIVGTVGIVLVVQGLATIRYGANTIPIPQFLPGSADSFSVLGVVITDDKVILTATALLAVAGLSAFFRWSRRGLAMRAVVDDPELLAMHATDPLGVRRSAWIIGSALAALSGVLLAPTVGLNSIVLTYLVVQAAAAAAIGGFTNIPLTFVGGILIGIAANIAQKYAIQVSWLSGLPASVPFLVLFVVLLARGRTLVPPSRFEVRPPRQYRAPWQVRVIAGAIVLAVLALLPQVAGAQLSFFTTGLATALMLLSLGLLVRTSGQVSLCQTAFAAIGAVAFSQLHVNAGIPWIPALLLGGLVAVPVGAVVAIPAIRLSGLFLALATFGFGILVEQLLYPQSFMFTQLTTGREMPHPQFAQTPESFYYVVLAVVALAAVAVVTINRSRLGRMLRGLAGSGTSMPALGLGTNVLRVTVFCISAFIAAEAGVLIGVDRNFATGSDSFFASFGSLTLLATLALAPFAEPWYALVGVVAAAIPAYLQGAHTTDWLNVVFGVSAIAVAMTGGPKPLPRWAQARLERFRTGRGRAGAPRRAPTPRLPQASARGIEVRDLAIRFGGLVAVADLSLHGPLGQITGVIGPNGAGKTATFDACSGFNRRTSGRVLFRGKDITRLSAGERARRGLGRTFQSVELCDTLTVTENVRLGHEASLAGINPVRQIAASRGAWRATEVAAADALELCGIARLADAEAGSLSTGQRRLVELARCLAGPFDYLLLDEPSSGLDLDETNQFGDLLARVVSERGLGVLLVEHDMALVMRLCSYIYVMDFGRLIFDGGPKEVAASELVRSAYLGSEEVMVAEEVPQL